MHRGSVIRLFTDGLAWGISAGDHDAALAVVDGRDILFAAHAERYSRVKNDPHLNEDLIADALQFGSPSQVVLHERPLLKATRKWLSGQAFESPTRARKATSDLARMLRKLGVEAPIRLVGHHRSHAAAAYLLSDLPSAAIVVVDAIGEWTTTSVWHGEGDQIRLVWTQNYPHSVGLFYSAFTRRCGFRPNEEEFFLMALAAYGEPSLTDEIKADFVATDVAPRFELKMNVHRGVDWWRPDIDRTEDIAASVQRITEDYLVDLCRWARKKTSETRLALCGGVALNCKANSRIAEASGFDEVVVPANPGDAGSSLGAIAAFGSRRLAFRSPFLGHTIGGAPDVDAVVAALVEGEIVGLAHGRAEFGPRALGGRSLLCDPRKPDAQARVNAVKRRDRFRPFAPAVLQEHFHDLFDGPAPYTPYMQFVAHVRNPRAYPGVTHVDGTARVQTVAADQGVFRRVLEGFHQRTGCPALLNTSLNVKGEPLVNTREDCRRFEETHGVRVF